MVQILAVTPLYPPVSRVGAWLATHQFLRHLVTRGHDVSVVASRSHSDFECDGIRVYAGVKGRTAPHRLAASPDVVVSHAGDGGLGLDLAAEHGKPSVRMVHGAGYDRIGEADLAVFNSESLRDLAAWPGRSVVCHPPTFPSDHRVPSTGDAVTIVNCSKDKGIKTAWRCSEQLPDRKFLGVKGGYGYQITPRGSNFEVIPTQSDMRAVWSRTRVLLVPSAYETWGMVGVEAMCSGIPVIAHPTPGLQESLGAAGIFVDRDDTDGWVRELHRLEDPAEYATASAAALARVDDLDPQVSLDRFAAAVEALCGS
jgi:glycosyltransferase involved in cell wall biosynthesis